MERAFPNSIPVFLLFSSFSPLYYALLFPSRLFSTLSIMENIVPFWKFHFAFYHARELLTPLEGGHKMVLATAGTDGPSARMMSVIVREGCLYFQTDRTMRKYKQLAASCTPRSALITGSWKACVNCWDTPRSTNGSAAPISRPFPARSSGIPCWKKNDCFGLCRSMSSAGCMKRGNRCCCAGPVQQVQLKKNPIVHKTT